MKDNSDPLRDNALNRNGNCIFGGSSGDGRGDTVIGGGECSG